MLQKYSLYSLIILLIGIFSICAYISLDPDFGWHLRMGQLIIASGIPKTDPFSYTMPSFPLIDHEWISNIVFFKLYFLVGKVGLSIIFALLCILALLLTLSKKDFKFALVPFLLASTVLLSFSGIRPQVESWFLMAILLRILTSQRLWKRWRFGLPVIFTLWANLHGGFALGLAVLLLYILFLIFKEHKFKFTNFLILFLSILATFLNPYGVRIYSEVWMTISDGRLRWSIEEWYPMLFEIDLAFYLLLSLSLFFILKFKTRFSFFEKILYFGLLLAGLSSQRHIPFWLIITLPITAKSLKLFYEETYQNKTKRVRFKKAYKILVFSTIIVCITSVIMIIQDKKSFSEENYYPKRAISFLKNLPKDHQILAPYNSGGFLIWNLADRKVFIDGRMPSWRWNSPLSDESNWAFKEYRLLLEDKDQTEAILKKYNVGYVLWYKGQTQPKNQFQIIKVMEKLYNRLTNKKDSLELTTNLANHGWREIYQDSIFVIYQR